MQDVSRFFVAPDRSIRDAVRTIDAAAQGIALVVDGERRLHGTVTDGDVRRAMLAGVDFSQPVSTLLAGRPWHPTTAPAGTPDAALLATMRRKSIRHIPVLDAEGRVVRLALFAELADDEPPLELQAVVMAGGFGSRLKPLTDTVPKPMLPVGDKPLLEHIVSQLSRAGIVDVHLTTHFMGEVIENHFRDGSDFGVRIRYVQEDRPLGTAGAIGLVDAADKPLLVMNGDLLTKVDFRAMLEFHRERGARMTVAVREHETQIPYGVVDVEGGLITGFREKPVLRHFINAGIYLIDRAMLAFLEPNERCDMPQFIMRLVAAGHRVASFPIHEYWMDIGQMRDYEKANDDHRKGAV